MKLDAYLRREKLTDAEFGQRVEASQHTVRKWRRGERKPREHVSRIVAATGGAVTANDFYEMDASYSGAE